MGRNAADIYAEHGVELDEDELAHYGKLGMRWGRRNKSKSSSGDGNHASEPAKPHAKSMSDDELKSAINRLKLEKEYNTLTAPQISNGKKIVTKLLLESGQELAKQYVMSKGRQMMFEGGAKQVLKTAAKAAAADPAKVARPVMQFATGSDRRF